MSTFEKEAIGNDFFYYQRGLVKTDKIWTRPSYKKIKNLFERIKSETDILDRYKLYLIGGILFSFENTWDVDLCMTGNFNNYEMLEKDMNIIYEISLNEVQMLIDIQWMETPPPKVSFSELTSLNFESFKIKFLKTTYIVKTVGNEKSIIDLRNREDIKKVTEFLVEGIHNEYPKSKKKFLNRIFEYPDKTLITFVDVHDFLDNDYSFFIKNTNRF
jgi:hypothetical protein